MTDHHAHGPPGRQAASTSLPRGRGSAHPRDQPRCRPSALSRSCASAERPSSAPPQSIEQLDAKVPGWLSAAPVGGEAGYLIAAEAVLRALVDAEDRGRSTLSEIDLLEALGDAKPLGATAGAVRLIVSAAARPRRWAWRRQESAVCSSVAAWSSNAPNSSRRGRGIR